jgi:hypothetical protein
MRIGIRVSPRSSGGGFVFVNNLTASLRQDPRCESVTVFVMGTETSFDVPGQVLVDVPDSAVGRRMTGSRALARAVAEHPIDLLLCPGNEVASLDGVPTVMWPLTVAPFEEPAMRQLGRTPKALARWRLLRRSLRAALGDSDALVFSSHYARGLYRSNFPELGALPSTVIPPAPSLRADAPDVETPALPDRYVLFVSHLYPYKMVLEMLRGFGSAVRAGLSSDLVIAGNAPNGEYRDAVDREVVAQGLGGRVRFLGSVPMERLPFLYRRAECFLFPSLSENAGSFALIDAFVFGVPVLASSTSSMPECCGRAALYFDPRDSDQLAASLLRLEHERGLRHDLAVASHDRGAEFHYWDGIAYQFIEFSRRLASR